MISKITRHASHKVLVESHVIICLDRKFASAFTCILEETWELPGLDMPLPASGSCWSGTKPCVLSEQRKTSSEHFGFLKKRRTTKKPDEVFVRIWLVTNSWLPSFFKHFSLCVENSFKPKNKQTNKKTDYNVHNSYGGYVNVHHGFKTCCKISTMLLDRFLKAKSTTEESS